MVNNMLKNPAVKLEVEKLNREEFAILDETLSRLRDTTHAPPVQIKT